MIVVVRMETVSRHVFESFYVQHHDISRHPRLWSRGDVEKVLAWIVDRVSFRKSKNQKIDSSVLCIYSGEQLLTMTLEHLQNNAMNKSFGSFVYKSLRMLTQRAERNGKNNTKKRLLLWQFIIDLLFDGNHQDVISWTNVKWEFEIKKPKVFVGMWRQLTNKAKSTYTNISRTLRYYHSMPDSIMRKEVGVRVYRFTDNIMNAIHNCTSEEWRRQFEMKLTNKVKRDARSICHDESG